MPEFVKAWIEGLDQDQLAELFLWMDNSETAPDDILDFIMSVMED